MNPDVSKADPARSSALLIGNKNYPNSALPVFPAAEDNLAALGNAFRDPKLWGLRGRRLSVDHDLERADFLDSVRLTARSSEHGGLLVLYFAGHAEKDSGMLYLAPSDGDPADPANSMISVAEIFRAVGQETGAASRKLLILDCCYAGQAVRAMPTEPVPVGDAQGWLIMAATAPTATALAHPERTHSLFTAALLEAFKGAPEASRGLSPRWISERVDALIPELEEESKRLKPYTSNAGWMDDPWLHNRSYSERRRTPYVAPTLGNDAPPSKLPNGFPSWPTQEPLYIGRAEELRQAQERLRQRSVLSITGPRYAGKAAFVRQLLAMPKMPESGPTEQPWLLMEIAVINPSAESPVLEAMAKALEVRLQDGGQGLDTGRDSRRELIMERLREHTRGRTLLLVIDCGRLGYDSQRVTAELDELLEDPYFRDTANVVISRVTLMVDGDEQLDRQPEIRLQELADEEAAKLLTTLLARRKITVDGTSVLAQIGDRRMRLPGVLTTSAAGFPGGESQDAPEPADVASALLEGSARSVAKTLDEFGCRIGPEPKPSTPQQLAVLMVWALADHLAFPATVLEDPAIGIGRRLLLLLEDARVIFKIGNGWLEIGEVSKQALRSLLLTALKRDQDAEDPLSPRPLAFELKKLFAPEMDTRGLDSALTLAASALFLTALDPRKADDEVLNPAVLHGARWAIGWIEDEIDGGLPLLRRRLQTFVLAPAGDELFLPSKLTEPETEQAALAAGVSPLRTRSRSLPRCSRSSGFTRR